MEEKQNTQNNTQNIQNDNSIDYIKNENEEYSIKDNLQTLNEIKNFFKIDKIVRIKLYKLNNKIINYIYIYFILENKCNY